MAHHSEHRIILVSDGTGETAAQMTRAAMVQFSDRRVFFTRYKNVRTADQIDAICEDAAIHRDLVVYTLVSPELRAYLANLAREKAIPNIDLLGPLLVRLAGYFGYEPKSVAGLLHDVNERYFERIDAMEYTIAHDDGRDLSGLDKADLIILGISRTSKTPLSMYLSHHGWKVANIPLIQGYEVPKEVFETDQRKVVGLTIDPENLATIRRARLERLGHDQGADYADPENVNQEIEYANEIFARNRRWPVFNVTGKALEETSAEIMKLMESRRLAPGQSPEGAALVPSGSHDPKSIMLPTNGASAPVKTTKSGKKKKPGLKSKKR
ncbi:MAG TPA: pyruvate, water dikinase regulatory protein [Bdellovibrionota bacterium]|nr:pyruvate, water dikinase regulatory protein [Bdellovibrionota bacterium]